MEEKINNQRLIILIVSILFCAIVLACAFSFSGRDFSRLHPEKGVLNRQDWQPGQDAMSSS